MDFEFYDVSDLLITAEEKQLYPKLLSQLQKDFDLCNIQFDDILTLTPEALKTLLHEKIYYLLLEKFDTYLNLLYIIDVPEKEFRHINMTDAVEVAGQVSFLVLKRELQKVWYKKKYSP